MQFNVGPHQYTLILTSDPLRLTPGGAEKLGLCDSLERRIYISARLVPPDQRLDILLHELAHAWCFACPGAGNTASSPNSSADEHQAEFFATIAKGAMLDLARQGGLDALRHLPIVPITCPELRYLANPHHTADISAASTPQPISGFPGPDYVPLAQVEPWQTSARSHAGRAQCGRCEMIIADGSIHTEPPYRCPTAKGYVCQRTLYCPHCHHLVHWTEGVDLQGQPNGAVVAGPTYTRGPDVDTFLRTHPHTVGLVAE